MEGKAEKLRRRFLRASQAAGGDSALSGAAVGVGAACALAGARSPSVRTAEP